MKILMVYTILSLIETSAPEVAAKSIADHYLIQPNHAGVPALRGV